MNTMTHKLPDAEIAPNQDIISIIDKAVVANVDVDKLEKLLALQERWEKTQARKCFFVAMTDFQFDVPPIGKNKEGHNSRYSDIEKVVTTIKPFLKQFGFSFHFKQTQENGTIQITCVVSHIQGHQEDTSLSASADTSGNKNAIQGIGSTVQYLRRYTLLSAFGLVTADTDNDGQTPAKEEKHISKEQEITILSLCEEVGLSLDKYLEILEIKTLPELPAKLYPKVIRSLEKRRKVA